MNSYSSICAISYSLEGGGRVLVYGCVCLAGEEGEEADHGVKEEDDWTYVSSLRGLLSRSLELD